MPNVRWRPGLRPIPRWSSRHSSKPSNRLGRGHPLPNPPPPPRRLWLLDFRAFGAQLLCPQCKILATPLGLSGPVNYLRQGGYVLSDCCLFVCLSVCLSVCLFVCIATSRKNYCSNLHENFIKDCMDREELVKFLKSSRLDLNQGNFLTHYSTLRDWTFSTICLIYLG